MKLFMYLILGFIQGFTEPIPVSSSGHLVIFNSILNVEAFKDLNFEIITNFGSFIAIVYFYRKEIISIIKAPFVISLILLLFVFVVVFFTLVSFLIAIF